MPCHPARARELIRKGRAVRRFNKGIFYVRLLNRASGKVQPIACGIDPGSKKEGFTIKSGAHTFLNIQADAVTWVKKHVEQRRMMRRNRRSRNTPCRKPRFHRSGSILPPSTKARWGWKLRIVNWLLKFYPISGFVVEDIKAVARKGQRRWNVSFGPLQVGKKWFYFELAKLGHLEIKQSWKTKKLRDALGLKKTSNKKAEVFEAHCIDSWVLANWWVEGHVQPDNTRLLCIAPPKFHRRQLHYLQPNKNGIRRSYGGTRSLGFKRGSLVKHPRHGLCYIGGTMKDRVSLHSLETGRRLSQEAFPHDCKFLMFNAWKIWYPSKDCLGKQHG